MEDLLNNKIGVAKILTEYKTLIYLCLISAIAELAFAIMNQSAIPPYLETINLKSQAGFIIGVFLIVEAVLKSPMGSLGDRIGRRPLIVGGALISAVTSLLMTVVHQLPYLVLLRTFDGIAAAAIWPTLIAAVSGSVKTNMRTMAMNAVTAAYIVGVALGPLFGGWINDYTGSKLSSFYLISGLFFLIAIIAYFLTPHRSKEEDELKDDGSEFKLKDIALGLKTIPDMMAIAFITFLGIGLLIPVIKYFAMDELKLSETGFGILILPIAAVVAIAGLVISKMGGKWSKAGSVRLGITLCVIGMWLIIFSRQPWQTAICGMLLGIGFVFAMPSWLALISDMSSPRVRGTVVGALGTSQGIGAWIGTNLGMYFYEKVVIFQHLGSHYTPFVFTAISLTISLILALIFIRDNDARRIG